MSHVRHQYENKGLPDEAINLIILSWRDATKAIYNTYISQWFMVWGERDVNFLSPPLAQVAEFMTGMYVDGRDYITINTARSVLLWLGLKFDGVNYQLELTQLSKD